MGDLRGGATVAGFPIWHAGNLNKNEFSQPGHQHVIGDISGLQTALDGKSDTGHNHDDRYYTETELGATTSGSAGANKIGVTAISGVTGTNVQTVLGSLKGLIDSHDHNTVYYTKTNMSTSGQSSVHWGNLTNVPASFTPAVHNHDDRYFTETELMSTTLGSSGASKIGSSSISGVTGLNVQAVLENLKTQIDGKSDSSHNHDSVYAKLTGSNLTGSMLWSGDQDYKGLYWGSKYEDAAAHEGTWAYIRQGTAAGQIEIGSDDLIEFYETDSRALVASMSTNNKTFDVKGSLLENGTKLEDKYLKINDYQDDSKLSSYGSTYDSNKKVHKVVDYKRTDGTLEIKSTLSNPDIAGNYQTLVVQYYAANGTTVTSTQTWTLTYNSDGQIVSKVVA